MIRNKASDNKFLYERIVDEIRRTKSRENDIICMYDENKDILDIYNVYKKDFDSFITKYEKSMTECDRLRGEFWFRYNFLCESCVRSFNRNNGTKIKEIEDIAKIDESFYKDEMKAIGVSTSGLSKQIEKAEQDKSLKNKKLDLAIKVKKYILKLVKENNYFMFTTYYSDNNGDLGNIMEHSGIFDAVKHVTINRH
jgi:transposase-like protein